MNKDQIIPLHVDTSAWKPGMAFKDLKVKKANFLRWRVKHEHTRKKKKPTPMVRVEHTDGFRIFINIACLDCKEFYIIDEVRLRTPLQEIA